MNWHLAILTVALYAVFVGFGWLAVNGGSPIDIRLVLLGPLLPLAHSVRYALLPARDADVWYGFITLVPICAWYVAARWYQHAWFERLAVLSIVSLYGVLLIALGLGA